MLIGHEELKKEFCALADKSALAQGYMFYGSPRVGKLAFAKSLANYLETGHFDKNAMAALSDFLLLGPDEAGSIGIDRAREIKKFLWKKPIISAYRTVVLNGAEALTDEAQNALLKITEEPPQTSLLLFLVDDPEKIRQTLQSRLRKTYFGPVSSQKIEKFLVGEYAVTKEKARELSLKSMGCPGLAVELADNKSGISKMLSSAEKFLKKNSATSAWIKDLVSEENFRMDEFLEALAIAAAGSGCKNYVFWHRLLDLRRQSSYFNLNPRIQLVALSKTIL